MPEDDPRPLRPFWSGTITFGLVSVPVNLYPATVSGRPSLRMVDEDGTPLERRYWCPADEREVGRDEIVRGFVTDDDTVVVLTDDELESLAPEKSREIDLRRFVDRDELDPLFFQRAYLLAPSGETTRPYRLLAAAMERSGRAGIATFVMRGKEYLVAILAEDGVLRAETMRFAHEIRTWEDVGVPEPGEADDERVGAIREAIRSAAAAHLDESDLEDPWTGRLESLVDDKLENDRDVVDRPEGMEAESPSGTTRVIDLMEALKRSLASEGVEGRAPPARSGRRTPPDADLADLTRDELYERARELDVPGRSSMTKAELADAIRSA